jgi:hypothetical protein
MDYTVGQARYTVNDARLAAHQSPAVPANSIRARTYTATGGSAGYEYYDRRTSHSSF